jgi:hypothetical protein
MVPTIQIDGASLLERFGYASQEPGLFFGT